MDRQKGTVLIWALILVTILSAAMLSVLNSLHEQQLAVELFKRSLTRRVHLFTVLRQLEISNASCMQETSDHNAYFFEHLPMRSCHWSPNYHYVVETLTPNLRRITLQEEEGTRLQSVITGHGDRVALLTCDDFTRNCVAYDAQITNNSRN